MVVGEFTVSNIAMEEDQREEEKKKALSTLDLDKFKADVAAQEALAKQVRYRHSVCRCSAATLERSTAPPIARQRLACTVGIARQSTRRTAQLRHVATSAPHACCGGLPSSPSATCSVL